MVTFKVYSGDHIWFPTSLPLTLCIFYRQARNTNKIVEIKSGRATHIRVHVILLFDAGTFHCLQCFDTVGRALTEEHPACKNWLMRCWRGHLSTARCKLMTMPPHHRLLHHKPFWCQLTKVVLETEAVKRVSSLLLYSPPLICAQNLKCLASALPPKK